MSSFEDAVRTCIIGNSEDNMAMYRMAWGYRLALTYLPVFRSLVMVYIVDGHSCISPSIILDEDLEAEDWSWHVISPV